jgi:hypothetical protein
VPESPSEINVELRRAVLSESYSEVQRLTLLFCEAVETHVRMLPPGDPSIPEIGAMVQETLQWTSAMVCSGRATLALQLTLIPKVKPYLQIVNFRPATLQCDV